MLALDSGAFSLYSKHAGITEDFSYFDTWAFLDYVDEYADFVRDHEEAIDWFVNVDVISRPEQSWEVLKYMESDGLAPMPVIHYGADLHWVEKHLEAGYQYLGIGGPRTLHTSTYARWADQMFKLICPRRHDKPLVKTHGFGMTRHDLLMRYPWTTVDSKTWLQAAFNGQIWVPPRTRNGFAFDLRPRIVPIGQTRRRNTIRWHVLRDVREWLDSIGLPLGENEEPGVTNDDHTRTIANLAYFDALSKHSGKMIFTSSGSQSTPESLFDEANVMLSYYELRENRETMKRLKRHSGKRSSAPSYCPTTGVRHTTKKSPPNRNSIWTVRSLPSAIREGV